MASTPDLTPPGSTVYSSETMYVGDGTWQKTSNTFLLPNLQGLNFATMRLNGMGNRFRLQPNYHSLIQVHGILATIVFLFLVPFAILFLRFGRRPRWALKFHIWAQILTVLLTTAAFILPFFVVGPTRSLTNPHHGIGVALFVLVMVQFLLGWLTYRREKKKRARVVPIKTVLHRWIGRATALLGIIQIPLGLTLYGSPMFLFILYALVMFALTVTYFILSYIDEKNEGRDIHSDYSWASGSGSTVSQRRQGRFGKFAKTAAAAGGAGFLVHKLRNRHEAVPSRRNSHTHIEEEKISEHSSHSGHHDQGGGWKGKLLGAGALAGLGYYAGKLFRRNPKPEGSISSGYYTEESDLSRRQEEGMSPAAAGPTVVAGAAAPLDRPLGHRKSNSSVSYDDYMSASPSRQPRKGTGLRNGLLGIGAFGIGRKLFKDRREREEEWINRADSRRTKKFTGDGYHRPGRTSSLTSTNLTPTPLGGAVASGAIPPPSIAGGQSTLSGAQPVYAAPPTIDGQPLPVVPPPPQAVQQSVHDNDSDVFSSPGRRHHHGGSAANLASGHRRTRSSSRRRQSGSTGQMASPPVSVKLNMHNDGRHVTLRRLTEEEAQLERERRAAAADGGLTGSRPRPPRVGASSSIISGTDAGYATDHYRRMEDREREQQIAMDRQQLQASQAALHAGTTIPPVPPAANMPQPPPGNLPIPMPAPPPIPGSETHGYGPGSVGSPGTYDGNTTDGAASNYDKNRRRRRAERAAAAQARAARGQGRVEFE